MTERARATERERGGGVSGARTDRQRNRDGDGKLYYRFFAVNVAPCIRVCSQLSVEHRLPRV